MQVDPRHAQSLLGLAQLEARAGNTTAALQVGSSRHRICCSCRYLACSRNGRPGTSPRVGMARRQPAAHACSSHLNYQIQKGNKSICVCPATQLYLRGLEAHPGSVHLLSSLAQLHAQVSSWRRCIGVETAASACRWAGWTQRRRSSPLLLPAMATPPLLGARALLLPQMGDEPAAREAWLRVVKLERSNGHACYALGTAEQREGHQEAAEAWYRRGCDSKGEYLRVRLRGCPAAAATPHGWHTGPHPSCRRSTLFRACWQLVPAAAPAAHARCLSLPFVQTPRERCCAMKRLQSCWHSRRRWVCSL